MGMVSILDDDGGPAGADAVLSATMLSTGSGSDASRLCAIFPAVPEMADAGWRWRCVCVRARGRVQAQRTRYEVGRAVGAHTAW